MKILLDGESLPDDRLIQATCSNCTCAFEFQVKEAKRNSRKRDSWWEIRCPACGELVFVSECPTCNKPVFVS